MPYATESKTTDLSRNRVTMDLTDCDIANADAIEVATSSPNKASAVAIALSLTRFIVDRIRQGDVLCFRSPSGDLERVIMQELEHLDGSWWRKRSGITCSTP